MKLQAQKDERITAAKQRIQSNGFQVVWLVLLVSILIQQHLYGAPFAQYAVELLVLLAMSLYLVVANLVAGNDIFAAKKRGHGMIVLNSLVAGGVIAIINTVINYSNYSGAIRHSPAFHIVLVAGATFVSMSVFTFLVLEVFYFINLKKQQAIDEKLQSDDTLE